MRKTYLGVFLFFLILLNLFATNNRLFSQEFNRDMETFQPLAYAEADKLAESILAQMTLDEKIALIGGDKYFFIRALPRLNLSEIYMSDATQGIHIRQSFNEIDLSDYQPEKSTAFPCPISLSATWNRELAYQYARAIGEECKAANIGILLGPGMNIYRQSQCGRNFEYFGEDPYLAARMIENYVQGVQSTGTVATLKHFLANNTEYYRKKSNSVVDERTLHEIYMPAFKAGIEAGAKAVMTSYNLLNGEWCGESAYVINYLLRNQLGFQWLVMTDWWSVYNGEKLAKSGQNLEMPFTIALENVHQLLEDNKVQVSDIDRMAQSILRTCFAMKLYGRSRTAVEDDFYEAHEKVALQTAREGIVLLKNEGNILPVKEQVKNILVTGDYVKKLAVGGGSAYVEGYNNRQMISELQKVFGDRIKYIKNPTVKQIKSAQLVLCNVGTSDSEGWDRPFELPEDQEQKVLKCVNNNPNTVVIVTSGSGIRMTGWNEKARAIIYAWYPGQIGNQALAEILIGKVNPSGKLPITIEKEFKDSPGYGYIPEGESLYFDWNGEGERAHPVYDVRYKEGIFIGYRWYESQKIEPLYPFGHGLSFTSFSYSDLQVTPGKFSEVDTVSVTFSVKNVGKCQGAEIVQLYVSDLESSLPRPAKELKGFQKIVLEPGEIKTVTLKLSQKDFAFWSTAIKNWTTEKGKFVILICSSSQDIRLSKEIELL
ncbi:MAG TPA: glycoside hydrolase family 3 C-terminal domain-containing protein [Candidatus Marinimicrobia bacterium]|jgi:beta-glucosidase|nr:glycoside hydrolase family 3 C-terminal domain-containing protein [Candidatus Neomarinimicrobiota bacterium]